MSYAPSPTEAMTVSKPPMCWAQREELVFITIPIQDATDVHIDVNKRAFHFACTTPSSGCYGVSLELFADVVAEESQFVTRPRQVEVKLKKCAVEEVDASTASELERVEASFWPRLTREKTKLAFLTTDWAKWKEPEDLVSRDDDDDDLLGGFGEGGGNPSSGMDLSEMLGRMRAEGKAFREKQLAEPVATGSDVIATGARSEKDVDEEDDMPPLEETH